MPGRRRRAVSSCRRGRSPPAPAGPPRIRGTTAGHGNFLWTNTNVGEAIPDVHDPGDLVDGAGLLADAMATASIPPYVGYGRIGGRIYLNVSVMATLSGVVGVNERQFRTLDRGGVRPAARRHRDPAGQGALAEDAGLGGAGGRSTCSREAKRDSRSLDGYLAGHPQLVHRTPGPDRRHPVRPRAGPAVADADRTRVPPGRHDAVRRDPQSAVPRSSPPGSGCRVWSATQQANAITAGLGAAVRPAGQPRAAGRVWSSWRAGEIDRATFNLDYGHRGPHEFEISTPRPGEDPAWIDRQLAARLDRRHRAIRDLLRRQEAARDAAWGGWPSDHPLQARLLPSAAATAGRRSPATGSTPGPR